MKTNTIARVIIGLALIGYGLYSENAWFYLGVIPLLTGLINYCPLEMKMGTCDPESGCCATSADKIQSACCAPIKDNHEIKIRSFKPVAKPQDGITKIEILGVGCTKCVALGKAINTAIKALDGEYEVKKVSDIKEIMAYNVVSTPGLVVNGTVVSVGKLLTVDEVKKILVVK